MSVLEAAHMYYPFIVIFSMLFGLVGNIPDYTKQQSDKSIGLPYPVKKLPAPPAPPKKK